MTDLNCHFQILLQKIETSSWTERMFTLIEKINKLEYIHEVSVLKRV